MNLARKLKQAWLGYTSRSGAEYWERRYRLGMDSGDGSYGELARFKAETLNAFVAETGVRSVIEFGCGDGNQLTLARYPRYLGLDVSAAAIERCAKLFAGDATKSFLWYAPAHAVNLHAALRAELTLSLDVVYHLLEEATYHAYLELLFGAATRYVIVYSSDGEDARPAPHVRHWRFTDDVARMQPEFRIVRSLQNPYPDRTFARFFIFERVAG